MGKESGSRDREVVGSSPTWGFHVFFASWTVEALSVGFRGKGTFFFASFQQYWWEEDGPGVVACRGALEGRLFSQVREAAVPRSTPESGPNITHPPIPMTLDTRYLGQRLLSATNSASGTDLPSPTGTGRQRCQLPFVLALPHRLTLSSLPSSEVADKCSSGRRASGVFGFGAEPTSHSSLSFFAVSSNRWGVRPPVLFWGECLSVTRQECLPLGHCSADIMDWLRHLVFPARLLEDLGGDT